MAESYITGMGLTAAAAKSTAPTNNKGFSASQIRIMERQRNPKQEPFQTNIPKAGTPIDPKVDAYIKDYIKQMRAAGYPDHIIKRNLLSGGNTIEIPDTWQPGDTVWAGGMAKEFNTSPEGGAIAPLPLNIPGAAGGEYQNFMPGGTASRLPTYGEQSGRYVTTPFNSAPGQFSQNEQSSLSNALAQYMANYKGAKVPFSQWASEAGFVGLPTSLANQWGPEKAALDAADARGVVESDKARAIYEQWAHDYPDAGILPSDTEPEMIAKMAHYKTTQTDTAAADKTATQSKSDNDALIREGTSLMTDWAKAQAAGEDSKT
jgi:hypothetical protein